MNSRSAWIGVKGRMLPVILAGVGALSALGQQTVEVRIEAVAGKMRYDLEWFQVPPGSFVRLEFRNPDEMQHNLLILTQGKETAMRVAQRAWALGPLAVERNFVPEGPEVLFSSKVLNPKGSQVMEFKAPSEGGDYPFVCTLPGHAFTMQGVMRVAEGQPSVKRWEEAKPGARGGQDYFLRPEGVPLVQRVFIENAPARSIAVGLPGGINYCFDADAGYVRFGWFGGYLDVGPDRRNRGGGWCKILGERFEVGDAGFPLRLGEEGRIPSVRFTGYRRPSPQTSTSSHSHGDTSSNLPEFWFELDGKIQGKLTVEPSPKGIGLLFHYELEGLTEPMQVVMGADGLTVESDAGSFCSGRLHLSAQAAKRFSLSSYRIP